VRWAGWRQSIGNWTSYARSGWSVKRGILNLDATAGGVRRCSTDAGVAYCNSVVALFAPYSPPGRKYSIFTTFRIISCPECNNRIWNQIGLVFRFRPLQSPVARTVPGIFGSWVIENPFGFESNCLLPSGAPPSSGESLGVCRSTWWGQPNPLDYSWSHWTPGSKWHTYQVQVRDSLYRLLIDGRLRHRVHDPRPDNALGRQFGFFVEDSHIQVGQVSVSDLR
jgi:hypothetical protein